MLTEFISLNIDMWYDVSIFILFFFFVLYFIGPRVEKRKTKLLNTIEHRSILFAVVINIQVYITHRTDPNSTDPLYPEP